MFKTLKKMYEKKDNNGTTGCPTKIHVQHCGHDRCGNAFTLVELVIVIAIVIILSVISVPIYRGYVDKAKWSEAYALCGTILSAQKAYYSEYGNFLEYGGSVGATSYEPVLGVDIRGNKYFTWFYIGDGRGKTKLYFQSVIYKPIDLGGNRTNFWLQYNINKGIKIHEENDWDSSWVPA